MRGYGHGSFSYNHHVGAVVPETGQLIPVLDRGGMLTRHWVQWLGWDAVVPPEVRAHHDYQEIVRPSFLLAGEPQRGPFVLLFPGSPYLPVSASRLTRVALPSGPLAGQQFIGLASPEAEGLWHD